ncbi:hypothetical protein Bbelb_283930 [Branchiostoma belcheri]|nr:hypothetical protein Bbelb_283930 [Branchiostoma belcheri]
MAKSTDQLESEAKASKEEYDVDWLLTNQGNKPTVKVGAEDLFEDKAWHVHTRIDYLPYGTGYSGSSRRTSGATSAGSSGGAHDQQPAAVGGPAVLHQPVAVAGGPAAAGAHDQQPAAVGGPAVLHQPVAVAGGPAAAGAHDQQPAAVGGPAVLHQPVAVAGGPAAAGAHDQQPAAVGGPAVLHQPVAVAGGPAAAGAHDQQSAACFLPETCTTEDLEVLTPRGVLEEKSAAVVTHDAECFFSLLHHKTGEQPCTLKEFKYCWRKLVMQCRKRMDTNLPFYYWTLNERYTVDDCASFDVPPEAEEVPRLHQLRFRPREDSSIIAVRAFLSARNRPTLRQRFHYIAVCLPRVPEDLQQHIQRFSCLFHFPTLLHDWDRGMRNGKKRCHMLIAQASKATKLTEDNIKTMAKQLQSAHRSLLGTSTFFGLQVDETTDKKLVPLTCIEDNTPETHEPPQPFSDTYDIASEQFQQMIHLKMTSMTISEQQRNGIAQKTRGQST